MKSWTQGSAWLAGLLLVAFAITAAAQSVPSIVMSSTTTIYANGMSNPGKVVQDTCGNLYELESSGNLMEIPASGGSAVYLVSYGGIGSGDGLIGGVTIDKQNNLYVDNKWNADVIKIPSTNCVPNTAATTAVLNANGGGALQSVGNYWYDPGDIAVDASGNMFVYALYGPGMIYEQTATGTAVEVLASAAGISTITSLTTDASGNLFITAGTGSVYELTVASFGTGSPKAVVTGLNKAIGVAFDSAGNMYIGDSSTGTIYEVPFTTSGSSTTPALQYGSMYVVATGLQMSNPLTMSQDGKSILYSNSNTNIYELVPGSANFGSVAVGSTGTTTVNVAFNASESLAAIAFAPNSSFSSTGGTCAAGSYTAGHSCTIIAKFAPAVPGVATSGISLTNSNGAAIASAYLQGTGLGAGLTLDSGAVSSVGAGFTSPASIALDAAGDSYIADTGKNTVYEFKPGSTTAISIGAGLSKPSGVAVDGAGNVIIADTGNNQIVEVPVVNGALSNAAQVTLVTAFVLDSKSNKIPTPIAGAVLSSPAGVTVDGQGNLYIADTGNNRIVFVPYNGSWNLAEASVLGSNFTSPLATTVDPWGNLYVADSGSGQIYKLLAPFSSGIQQLVAVGYSNPSALATDASGSLFVVDQGAGTVLRIPYVSGSLNPNLAIEVGFGIAAPTGLALDQAGDLYVTDTTHAAAYEVNRVSITEAFGDWAVSSPSGALPVKVENEGNQQLTFASPYYTVTGNIGDFSLGTPSSECANGGTLASGAGCELDAIFQPTASGAKTETLVLSSNAQNAAAPQQVVFSGTGIAATATTTALAITSPAGGKPFFGQPITLTATVTAASGTPAGSVQLLVDGVIAAQATLSSGVGTFSLAMGLTGGSHSLQAVYLGNSSFDGSSSSTLALTVTTAPTTSTLVITAPYINPYSAVFGNTVTFTVTINSTGVGIPTGTVTFAKGATTLGIVALAPASGGAFQASLATTALPVGTDLVTATYSGDANYVTSSTSGTVIVVSVPTLITTASGTTISSGSTNNTVTFSATSYGGWNGIVGFSCLASSLPPNARCIWSPGQVEVIPSTPLTSTVIPTSTLTVTIDQPPQTTTAGKMIWWLGGVTGLLLFFARRRMTRGAWGTATMLIAVLLLGISASGLVACNSSPQFQTPSGASTITVYASADPFTALPSSATPTPPTQPCSSGGATPVYGPTQGPCTQLSFQIALTVQ
jgi:sugar lactone lactonase YvrE